MRSDELATRNVGRLAALNQQGVQVGGVDTHYLGCLLEQLCTPEQIDEAQEAHDIWLDVELDQIETAIRRRVLTAMPTTS
jgi:hypothetical protein